MQKDENFDWVIAAIPSFAGREFDESLHALEVAAALNCGSLRLDDIDEGYLGHAVSLLGIEAFVDVALRETEPKPSSMAPGISATGLPDKSTEEGAILGYFLRLLPQARELISSWFEQPSLRLLPQVAGGEVSVDVWTPGPVYVSLLGEAGEAGWRSRLFADAEEAQIYPLAGADQNAVTFEAGRIRIDLAQYPADGRWRGFYLAQEDPAGCGEDERELFILRRAEGGKATKPKARDAAGKLVQLILAGRVLDAWREAVADGEMDEAQLEVLVSMIYSQMEVLLGEASAEVVGSLNATSLAKPLSSDLKSLPRLLDSFKQALRDGMRERMEATE